MKRRSTSVAALVLLSAIASHLNAQDLDFRLQQIISVYDLTAPSCESQQNHDLSLSTAGEKLFETKLLSGGQDSGCSTCHLEEKALTDGLPISVGVGGVGEGLERMSALAGILVPRNSFTLFARGLEEYSAYFWDGKIQVLEDGQIVSPFGEELSKKFHSPLSVAAILPLVARDEFLGEKAIFDEPENLIINKFYYQEKYDAATNFYRDLIFFSEQPELQEIRNSLESAGISFESFELADIGNSLASFLIGGFSCFETSWSKYLTGDKAQLDEEQKRGAITFFGKGRCAACHAGPLFSDFGYHSIGTPQGGFGVSALGQDLGRSEITLDFRDRYKFRTPPLVKVSETAPYGHNGAFGTLDEVVLHHLNPVAIYEDYEWASEIEYMSVGKVLSSRDEVLSFIDILSRTELADLVKFLEAL
jgi:cytochrome c peroxidase